MISVEERISNNEEALRLSLKATKLIDKEIKFHKEAIMTILKAIDEVGDKLNRMDVEIRRAAQEGASSTPRRAEHGGSKGDDNILTSNQMGGSKG